MDTKRPKRRTDKDYPYTIQITESKKYTVSFTDGLGVLQTVEISKERGRLRNLPLIFAYEQKKENDPWHYTSLGCSARLPVPGHKQFHRRQVPVHSSDQIRKSCQQYGRLRTAECKGSSSGI